MKAKQVYENIKDVFKPKAIDMSMIEKELPDIISNNKRVNYLFSGDVSDILNLSEHTNDFFISKIKKIEEDHLELYQASKLLNNPLLEKYLDRFFDKTYHDSISSQRRYQGNHFVWLKENSNTRYRVLAAKFLNLNFYDIVKEYLDSLNIKMLDPKIFSGIIRCTLNKTMMPEQFETLYDLLEQKTDYTIYYNQKEGSKYIYPGAKTE